MAKIDINLSEPPPLTTFVNLRQTPPPLVDVKSERSLNIQEYVWTIRYSVNHDNMCGDTKFCDSMTWGEIGQE